MVFCDSINLKVYSILFYTPISLLFLVYLLKIESYNTIYFRCLFLSIDISFSLYRQKPKNNRELSK